MDNKLKIIFFGTPELVTPILDSLGSNFNLVGVVTVPDKVVGRKQLLTDSAISKKAKELKIPVFKPTKLDDNFNSKLRTLNSELIVVAAYGKIIPQDILDLPKFGAINVHPSKLPQYRGASPLQSAILNGDKITALTIIKMDAEMDHGPIIFQEDLELVEKDNFETLGNKIFTLAAKVLVNLIPDYIAGKIKEVEQDHLKASFCKIIKKEDGYFDISNPPSAEKLDQMIRAYYPWPNAWTRWNGKVVKFYPGGSSSAYPGGSSSAYPGGSSSAYPEGKIQMEGKNPVSIKEFLNGYPNFPVKEF